MNSIRVDWLTVSLTTDHYPAQDSWSGWQNVARYVSKTIMADHIALTEMEHPARFYEVSVKCLQTGARLDFSTSNGQGSRLVLPGKFWQIHADYTWDLLAKIITYHQAKCTRLDIALDYESEEGAFDVYTHWEQPVTKGKPRSITLFESGKGNTFVIGARSSDKFMRLYDKGEQMNIPGSWWRRCELELKGRFAAAVAPQIAADWHNAGWIMLDFLSAPRSEPHAILEVMLADTKPPPCIPKRPKPPAEEWYHLQVFPALKKLYKTDRDTYWRVIDSFKIELDKLGYE